MKMSKDAHYTNEKNALEKMLEIGSGVNDYREYAGNKVKDVLEEVKKGDTYWIADPKEPLPEVYYTVVQNHT